jgi:hypothetical protein
MGFERAPLNSITEAGVGGTARRRRGVHFRARSGLLHHQPLDARQVDETVSRFGGIDALINLAC